jgi:hypothetical protein
MDYDVKREAANTQNGDGEEVPKNGHEDTSPAGGDAGTEAENPPRGTRTQAGSYVPGSRSTRRGTKAWT